MVLDSLVRRIFHPARRPRQIALVTPLPPERTGIADYSHRLAIESGGVFQLYAAPAARELHLGAISTAPAGRNVRPLRRLGGDLHREMAAAVVMVGNSRHFVPILESIADMPGDPHGAPVILYLHDVFLLSLLGLVSAAPQLMATLSADHGRTIPAPAGPDEIVALVNQSVYGAAAIAKWLKPDLVLVNSASSKRILESEPGWPGHVRVEAVFHPVFPSRQRWQRGAGGMGIRVGSFGVSNPFKQFDVVIEAHRLLKQQDPDATLVLAGYGMETFAREANLAGVPGIEVHESPSDEALGSLMASVDIAVRLRAADLGETSGMVARLLAVGTPVIVSPIGASLDLGEAVAFVSPRADAAELAQLIAREVAQPGHRADAVRALLARRSPGQLVASIVDLAQGIRSMP